MRKKHIVRSLFATVLVDFWISFLNKQSIYPDKYYSQPQQLGDFAWLYFVRGELCARSCPRQGYVYLS